MSDGTRIRFGLPASTILMPVELPRPGTHVNLSLADHSNHSSAVGELDADGRTLTLDVPPGGMSDLHIPEGDALGVAWAIRGMMCRMRVIRSADRPGTSPTEFTVCIDDGPWMIERREFFRVDADQGVIIRRAAGERTGRTGNISRSGVLIFTSDECSVGETLDLTIDLGERCGGALECQATVVRAASEHTARAYGLEFIALPHDDDQRLVRFVAWQQQQL